jgi:hypothetical protein
MNTLLAQLNRRLEKRGEPVWFERFSGTGVNRPSVRAKVPAIVRALTVEQLIGSITQQNLFVIISPTHLLVDKKWPGGITPKVQGSVIELSDSRMPISSDNLYCRGQARSIQNVKAVFDKDECIRIEINVLG